MIVQQETNSFHFLTTKDAITVHADKSGVNKEDNVFYEPTLHWTLEAKENTQVVELSYALDEGLEWTAEHTGILNHAESGN